MIVGAIDQDAAHAALAHLGEGDLQVLPKATHQRPEWQIVAEMLLEAVEGSGPLMFAEIAIRKAVNAGKRAPEPAPRRRAKR